MEHEFYEITQKPLTAENAERAEIYPEHDYPEKELTERIIEAAINVHRILGPGFTEAVYEGAFEIELTLMGLKCYRQKEVNIIYKDSIAAIYRLDYVIEDRVIVELKAIDDIHFAQVLAYLKATSLQVGLLLNFNVTKMIDGIKRVVLSSANSAPSAVNKISRFIKNDKNPSL